MEEYICKICGEKFIDENNNKSNITKKFKIHLINIHKITLNEYILKYYFNNKVPTCACGCGTEIKWNKKNALYSENHGYHKYCSCAHVNGIPKNINNLQNKIEEFKCLECGKVFKGKRCSLANKIINHLKKEHNITVQKYILKHYFNNIIPKCSCGCGQNLKFHNRNALWNPLESFGKYADWGHIGRNIKQIRNNNKETYISRWENIEWIKEHYYKQYGKENIEKSAKDFLENNDITNIDIGKKYGIDIRTLKNIWIKLNLITKDQWIERCNYRKYSLSSKRRKQKFENKEEICSILYNIIKNFPQQYSIRSLIKYYNDNNLLQIETDVPIVLNSLVELYGEEIYDLLQYGIHSKEEIEFIKVLKYLVDGTYKIGLRLQYGKNKRESYIYDICINNHYIIEYDGEGFYHPKEKIELDKQKEQYAIKNGYEIIRISYKEFRDPNTYIKINKWINYD